jgi:hypothetical protein
MRSPNRSIALIVLLAAACDSSGPGSAPSLQLGGTSHAFGSVPVGGQSQPRRFTLSNAGDGPTNALSVLLSGPNSAEFVIVEDDCTGVALGPSADCRIDLQMRPTTLGTKAAKLEVRDGGGNSASVALAGTGAAGGIIMATSSHDFGPTGTTTPSLPYTFVVQNAGLIPVGPLQSAVSGPQAAHFEVTSDTCNGVTLATGTACAVAVRYRPSAVGASVAALTVSDGGTGSTSATLRGQAGQAVTLGIVPVSHSFGFAVPGTSEALVDVSVTNQSQATSSRLTARMVGSNPADFQIRADGCSGRELAAGASCALQVAFVRLEQGAATAALEVSDQFAGVASMALSGSGAGHAQLVATPSALTFAAQSVGAPSPPKSVTITNTGEAATQAITTQVVDCSYYYYYCSPAQDFELTGDGCLGAQLQPGASCVIAVSFKPLYRGGVFRLLTVSGGNAVASIPLSGEGLGLSVSPDAIVFPVTQRGTTSALRHVVVLNGASVATGPLTTVIEPSGFVIATDACTGTSLAVGASCTVAIRFAPSNSGEHAGVLTISGDPGGSVLVSLNGQATP